MEAVNTIGAKVGDRILLHFKSGDLIKVTFLLYVFPVLMLLLGAVVGQHSATSLNVDSSTLSVALGVAAFCFAFWYVRIKSKKMAANNAYRPKIIRVLK